MKGTALTRFGLSPGSETVVGVGEEAFGKFNFDTFPAFIRSEILFAQTMSLWETNLENTGVSGDRDLVELAPSEVANDAAPGDDAEDPRRDDMDLAEKTLGSSCGVGGKGFSSP